MKAAEEFIRTRLEERKYTGTYRALKPEGNLVDFCSNDYLGFARSAKLKSQIAEEIDRYPNSFNGSTGSRLLSGNLSYAEELEHQIAGFHQSEAGLLFNSGYDANLGLFSSLPQKGDTIIYDELIHASIIDGARLSYANRYKFLHNNLESLDDKLKQARGNCYVVIESVYSMDGDTPPILEILQLADRYGACLIVDEAHAVGLYPAGLIVAIGLQNRVFARIVTFGKALGCHGAIVLGSKLLREYLVNFARSFIYTTSTSFHQLASVKMAYELLASADSEIATLYQNIAIFKQAITCNTHFPLLESNSAVQCIVCNSNEKAIKAAAELQAAGLDIRPILSPTVAIGTERVRICLHGFNTLAEMQLLTSTLNKIIHAQ